MKTAAASVVDTIAPSKRPSRIENPWIQETNTPTSNAVSRTPIVERDSPCQRMGRTSVHSVSNPPEKRIKTSAMIPRDCTIDGLSNVMPPIPSDPANMPMARNKTSEGMPNRFESLIVKMLRMTRMEKTMKINSMEVGIVLLLSTLFRAQPDAVYSTDDRITLARKRCRHVVFLRPYCSHSCV